MEMLDSAVVTLVLKMREIVILMMSVKMVFYVDQTIAHFHLDFIYKLIVVINEFLEKKTFVKLEYLVEKMKEIAILMMNVKMVFFVPSRAQLHLVLAQKLIAVPQVCFEYHNNLCL